MEEKNRHFSRENYQIGRKTTAYTIGNCLKYTQQLKKMKDPLRGRVFSVLTDHKPLTYAFQKKARQHNTLPIETFGLYSALNHLICPKLLPHATTDKKERISVFFNFQHQMDRVLT